MTTALLGAVRAHAQTWRPYTLWYIGLVGLAGAGLTDGAHPVWRLVVAWGTPTIGWIGGHYLSDYFDRRLDAVSKPHRPIPSGRLRPATALRSGVACLLVVAALATVSGVWTLLVAVAAAAAIVAYGRGLKARGLAGNLVRGALGALTLAYGVAVAGPPMHWWVLLFVAAFWAHDSSSNLVGTLRDIAGDRAGGYHTLPVRHGNRVAVGAAAGLFALAVVAAGAGGWFVRDAVARVVFLAGLAVAATLGVLALRIVALDVTVMSMGAALHAHEVLVLERVWFAATVVALGLGPLVALAVAVPMLTITWWAQRNLRAAYEFGPTRTPTDAAPGARATVVAAPPIRRPSEPH
ncbi:UbiA family prenyltransferase [Micromonospora sp. NPDC050417]|uniref:UbiA family prenyltransferase n=1 Tax=Micromonospora sp. NPDC050417 TaxID=3364280 RepID=UPI0037B56A50